MKINLLSSENRRLNDDGERVNIKVEPEVKSKEVDNRRLMVKSEPDVKPKVITKPNIKPNKEHKQDVKPNIKFDRESNQDVKKPDTNEITYEEEKVALVLGISSSQYGGCLNDFSLQLKIVLSDHFIFSLSLS